MRSLKGCYIGDIMLKIGAWYKIKTDNYDFWVVRFHSIEYDSFNHMYDAYIVDSDNGKIRVYPSSNGEYHPLCDMVDIMEIERVSLEWVKSLGINC